MTMYNTVWFELADTKYGDEYLILYIGRQRTIRRWFKILTILFSASGIFSAFGNAQIPTIISCVIVGIVQLATSIESFIIHSESNIDELSKLRLLYFDKTNKLEELFYKLKNDKITDDDASKEFFELRGATKKIEELDTKLNIRGIKKLKEISHVRATNYLNKYYKYGRQETIKAANTPRTTITTPK